LQHGISSKKNNQGTLGKSQVLQTDPPTTGLHNSDKERDREKATGHMRVKIQKIDIKTEAQFYEHNCEQGDIESFQNMILHRRKHAYTRK
jgi:hypothetical protein